MSHIVFRNPETGLSAQYKILPDDDELNLHIEAMIDLMETTMKRKFTEIERTWLRQDNIKPLPIVVEFVYEYDPDFEDDDDREFEYERICVEMSGYNNGWITTYIAMRNLIIYCDDDNKIEIIVELFNRGKIISPYSFYTAACYSDYYYEHYDCVSEIAQSYASDDIYSDTWIYDYVDWDSAAADLLEGSWYYNEDSGIAIDLNDVSYWEYSKRNIFYHHRLKYAGEEFLSLDDFEQLNRQAPKPLTADEIMSFLGGDVI